MNKYQVPYFNSPDPDPPEPADVFGIDEYDYRVDRANEVTGHPTGIDADMERAMSDDPTKTGIFRSHRCWKCDDGARPCVNGGWNRCDFLRARND